MFNKKGQSLTETVLTLPIFFTLVFLGLQICHLGMAVVVTNYAAASIARKAVSDNISSAASVSNYSPDFNRMLVAGMTAGPQSLVGSFETPATTARNSSSSGIAPSGSRGTAIVGTIRVAAIAQLKPLPLMGYFLNPILGRSGGGSAQDFPSNCTPMGPVCYEGGQRPMFYVKGVSYARMNI